MPPIQRVESDQRTRPLPVSKAEISALPNDHRYNPDAWKTNLFIRMICIAGISVDTTSAAILFND